MTIKVDYSNWEARFGTQVKETLKATERVIDRAAQELKKRYEMRTPIGNPALWNWPAPPGYVPGTLRASWEMITEGTGAAKVISIYNPQPYAVRVETGWSTQAPKGMMRISNLEWASIVAKFSKGV